MRKSAEKPDQILVCYPQIKFYFTTPPRVRMLLVLVFRTVLMICTAIKTHHGKSTKQARKAVIEEFKLQDYRG